MTFRRALLPLLFLLPIATHAATPPVSGNVDILWQGETYTPPFYLGRALWGYQTRVTLVAVANVSTNPNSLIYRWTQDDTVLGNNSGVGKRSLSWSDSVLSLPTTIKVDVTMPDGVTSVGSATITLTPRASQTLVVEDNPLFGLMLHKAVGDSLTLNGQEVSFSALPLFSGVSTRIAPAETYAWLTSGSPARTGNKVTYRVPDGTSGSAEVTVRANNKNAIIEPLDKTFLVQFGQSNNI